MSALRAEIARIIDSEGAGYLVEITGIGLGEYVASFPNSRAAVALRKADAILRLIADAQTGRDPSAAQETDQAHDEP